MPEPASSFILVPDPHPTVVAERERISARRVMIGSRLGVWGLVGGFGTMTAFTVGAPISLAAAIYVMGAGVLVSGVGTVIAATGVLRRSGAVPRMIRTAALAGMPLGGVLAVLGITSLTKWEPLVAVVNAFTPAAGILGALVVILLLAGLFIAFRGGADHTPNPESHDLVP
jgi:hypothetical protein